MTTVDASHLSAIPYIDIKSVDGRFLGSSLFFDEGRWRLWTPVDAGFIELKIVEPLEMLYFARTPASKQDLYFHFLDFVAQRAAFPEVLHGFSGITDDVLNLIAVLSKIQLLHSSRDVVGDGIKRMITTEIEYLFSVCRSVFDLLQEIISRLWASIRLTDTSVNKKPLKPSFNDMVTFGGKPAALETLQSRFGLPVPLASVYLSFAEFFADLRSIRDNLMHHGSSVQTVFADDSDFLVSKHLRPFSTMQIWREDERRPNDLLPLSPALATVVYRTLSACEAFSRALGAMFAFPPPLVPGMGLFLRCPLAERFSAAMRDCAERVERTAAEVERTGSGEGAPAQ